MEIEVLVPELHLEPHAKKRRAVEDEHPVAKDSMDQIGRCGAHHDDLDREAERRFEPSLQLVGLVPEPRLKRPVEEDPDVDVAPGLLLTASPASEQPGRDRPADLPGEEGPKRRGESRIGHAGNCRPWTGKPRRRWAPTGDSPIPERDDGAVRVTVTLEAEVAARIRTLARKGRLSLEAALDAALWRGLAELLSGDRRQRSFLVEPHDGEFRRGFDPRRLNQLADQLEAEAFVEKGSRHLARAGRVAAAARIRALRLPVANVARMKAESVPAPRRPRRRRPAPGAGSATGPKG